jgi:hypothetical protein
MCQGSPASVQGRSAELGCKVLFLFGELAVAPQAVNFTAIAAPLQAVLCMDGQAEGRNVASEKKRKEEETKCFRR